MNIKTCCVLIAASALWGCENEPGTVLERTSSAAVAQPSKPLAPAESVAVEESIPTAIEAAPAGSAQAISAEDIENTAKNAEEQSHE
ncbi:MAG TPA: hypothetical protein VIZ65_02970 [Cellvibrionaceae bacterium]